MTTLLSTIIRDHQNTALESLPKLEWEFIGRLMTRRTHGSIAFFTFQNFEGRIQLFASKEWTEDFEDLCSQNIGSYVSVKGPLTRTKTDELSIEVHEWSVQAEALESFPDKWHGIVDPDTKYRQRYLDSWYNENFRHTMKLRSAVLRHLRNYLALEQFYEVETPILHPIHGGANAEPFVTNHRALGSDFYLRVAPELYLKRLIVAGMERVFEIGKVFRNEGISPRHNPEFTMLEAYLAPGDAKDVAQLCKDLITYVLVLCEVESQTLWADTKINWREWNEVFIPEMPGNSPEEKYEYFEREVAHTLINPTFVWIFPTSVSPLAAPLNGEFDWVDRFELYVGGIELANGYSELTDPNVQHGTFLSSWSDEDDIEEFGNWYNDHVDTDYIRALETGLPPTGGVGIGIDRLIMLMTEQTNIRDVVAFPTMKREDF